ncbi:hypothetical protein E4U53_004879, partial [Claviceps sorghi]
HGDVVRLDLDNAQDAWKVGQHFFLCFTESTIWQSHPFTPLNAPVVRRGLVRHSYILRAKAGETKNVAELARRKLAAAPGSGLASTPVLLTGGYGPDVLADVDGDANIVCVAGGTGIAFVLPILLHLASQTGGGPPDRKMQLIWAVRHARDVDWVAGEMAILRRCQAALGLTISLFATRDVAGSGASEKPPADDCCPCDAGVVCPPGLVVEATANASAESARRHPDLGRLVRDFVAATVAGRTLVFASGPGGMITDLREIVAGLNAPAKVWRGQERYDVALVCDDRLEW